VIATGAAGGDATISLAPDRRLPIRVEAIRTKLVTWLLTAGLPPQQIDPYGVSLAAQAIADAEEARALALKARDANARLKAMRVADAAGKTAMRFLDSLAARFRLPAKAAQPAKDEFAEFIASAAGKDL